jgi:hypothetical protein
MTISRVSRHDRRLSAGEFAPETLPYIFRAFRSGLKEL